MIQTKMMKVRPFREESATTCRQGGLQTGLQKKPWGSCGIGDRRVAMLPPRSLSTTTQRTVPVKAVAVAAAPEEAKEARAYLRSLRCSPTKARRVLNQIRDKDYETCLMLLEFMPYRACGPILKLLYSAAANAKTNLGMNKANLYVHECYADQGATLKRFRPRAQGRAAKIQKKNVPY